VRIGSPALPLLSEQDLVEAAVFQGLLPPEHLEQPEQAEPLTKLAQGGWRFELDDIGEVGLYGAYNALTDPAHGQKGPVAVRGDQRVRLGFGSQDAHALLEYAEGRSPLAKLEGEGYRFFDAEGRPLSGFRCDPATAWIGRRQKWASLSELGFSDPQAFPTRLAGLRACHETGAWDTDACTETWRMLEQGGFEPRQLAHRILRMGPHNGSGDQASRTRLALLALPEPVCRLGQLTMDGISAGGRPENDDQVRLAAMSALLQPEPKAAEVFEAIRLHEPPAALAAMERWLSDSEACPVPSGPAALVRRALPELTPPDRIWLSQAALAFSEDDERAFAATLTGRPAVEEFLRREADARKREVTRLVKPENVQGVQEGANRVIVGGSVVSKR
jgi:hypothetical protein